MTAYDARICDGSSDVCASDLQHQYSKTGEYGAWIHNAVLMPIITLITVLVLVLLIVVEVRYNRLANPVASKTSHTTLITMYWRSEARRVGQESVSTCCTRCRRSH